MCVCVGGGGDHDGEAGELKEKSIKGGGLGAVHAPALPPTSTYATATTMTHARMCPPTFPRPHPPTWQTAASPSSPMTLLSFVPVAATHPAPR